MEVVVSLNTQIYYKSSLLGQTPYNNKLY